MEYELEGRTWRHGPFTSRILDDAELDQRLGVAGLRRERWLDERRTWLAAVAAPDTSALLVEVPEADAAFGAERLRWDPSAPVIPAHVTILFPFVPPAAIDAGVRAELAAVARSVDAFEMRFARSGRFPKVVWLVPEPGEPLARLTDAVLQRWPEHPPYEGAHEEVVHHLTVADGAPPEVLARIEAELPRALPITTRATELTLVCRVGGHWHDVDRFPFRDAVPASSAGTIGGDA
jgi:2'-5' RNA ligase